MSRAKSGDCQARVVLWQLPKELDVDKVPTHLGRSHDVVGFGNDDDGDRYGVAVNEVLTPLRSPQAISSFLYNFVCRR